MTGRRWAPPLVWAVIILVLTSIPGARIPHVPLAQVDKLVHVMMYGFLGWLSVRAAGVPAGVRRAAAVIAAISLFGAADEFHQQFIPGRSMELFDWVADTVGAACGAALALGAASAGERT